MGVGVLRPWVPGMLRPWKQEHSCCSSPSLCHHQCEALAAVLCPAWWHPWVLLTGIGHMDFLCIISTLQ